VLLQQTIVDKNKPCYWYRY